MDRACCGGGAVICADCQIGGYVAGRRMAVSAADLPRHGQPDTIGHKRTNAAQNQRLAHATDQPRAGRMVAQQAQKGECAKGGGKGCPGVWIVVGRPSR